MCITAGQHLLHINEITMLNSPPSSDASASSNLSSVIKKVKQYIQRNTLNEEATNGLLARHDISMSATQYLFACAVCGYRNYTPLQPTVGRNFTTHHGFDPTNTFWVNVTISDETWALWNHPDNPAAKYVRARHFTKMPNGKTYFVYPQAIKFGATPADIVFYICTGDCSKLLKELCIEKDHQPLYSLLRGFDLGNLDLHNHFYLQEWAAAEPEKWQVFSATLDRHNPTRALETFCLTNVPMYVPPATYLERFLISSVRVFAGILKVIWQQNKLATVFRGHYIMYKQDSDIILPPVIENVKDILSVLKVVFTNDGISQRPNHAQFSKFVHNSPFEVNVDRLRRILACEAALNPDEHEHYHAYLRLLSQPQYCADLTALPELLFAAGFTLTDKLATLFDKLASSDTTASVVQDMEGRPGNSVTTSVVLPNRPTALDVLSTSDQRSAIFQEIYSILYPNKAVAVSTTGHALNDYTEFHKQIAGACGDIFLFGSSSLPTHTIFSQPFLDHLFYNVNSKARDNALLHYFLVNAKLRAAAASSVMVHARGNDSIMKELRELREDPTVEHELLTLVTSADVPRNNALLQKLTHILCVTGAHIPFSIFAKRAMVADMRALSQYNGLFSIFCTVTPNLEGDLLTFRFAQASISPDSFPMNADAFVAAGQQANEPSSINIDASFPTGRSLLEVNVPLNVAKFSTLNYNTPMAAAMFFKRSIEALFLLLIKLPLSHTVKHTSSVGERSAGIFGIPLSFCGAPDFQAKETAHMHILLATQLNPTVIFQITLASSAMYAFYIRR